MTTAVRNQKPKMALSIDNLLAYAVWRIAEAGEECTFERLVYECFTLFPNAFSLQRYPHWPDSARVDKTWLRCRTDRGWIIGSVQEGFRLTDRGAQAAAKVARSLGEDPADAALASESARARGRHDAMLRHIRRQASFAAYQTDPSGFTLSDSDLRITLSATLETPRRILRQNLRAYENAAKAHDDKEVIAFIDACKRILKEGAAS